MSGSIDEVRIYDVALTAQQVADLYSNKPPQDIDPVAYYDFEGNGILFPWLDKSGSGNHANGTIIYGNQVDSGEPKLGQCWELEGTEYLVGPATGSIVMTNYFTVSIWVYPTAYSPIINKLDAYGDYDGWTVSLHQQTVGKVSFYHGSWLTSLSTVPLNEWTLITMTLDASSTEIYINGVLDITGTGGLLNTTFTDFRIGRDYASGHTFFQGKLDEVRIYDTAISSNQVAMLYTGVSPTNELVAYYDFEGETTEPPDMILDKSAEKNDGNTLRRVSIIHGAGNDGSDAMEFEAGKDKIVLYHKIIETIPFTLSVWVNLDAVGTYGRFYDDATILLFCYGSGTTVALNVGAGVGINFPFYLNSWGHVVATRDSDGYFRLYLDGVLMSTSATPDTSISTSTLVTVGNNDVPSRGMNGTMDNLLILPRAMTAYEVEALYQQGR
jgi:hypothetical protein